MFSTTNAAMHRAPETHDAARPAGASLRERARIGVGGFRTGHVIELDEQVACIQDEHGQRFELARGTVGSPVFDRIERNARVSFRENVFRSVAEVQLPPRR
jgi:hypothetical protein